MNKNTWDVNKYMTVKEQVTKRLVERFPCCCGKQLMLITSLSFTELKQFLSQGKINGDSCIYNVDNLASDNMFGDEKILENETKKDTFRRIWKKKVTELCNQHGVGLPKHNLLFGDIMDIPLWMESDKPFDVVYADTCNNISDKFLSWLFHEDTYNGVADDGIMAFTLMLNRGKKLKLPEDAKDNGDKFLFYGAEYDDASNMEHYYNQMNGLAQLMESTGQWRLEEMIHYCEKARKSQMVSVICKKVKR